MVQKVVLLMALVSLVAGCSPKVKRQGAYRNFITPNANYFITRIGDVPEIDESAYRLAITGLIDRPDSLALEELRSLEMVEFPLTVECIGNPQRGPLLSTAVWRGFKLYDLLDSLGLDEQATGVVYRSADGYYASHTLDQVRDNGVIGALYMNGEPIPVKHGFPLRILNPGYYGVKQPGWVTELEIVDVPINDYWEDRGWDCSPPMAVDATIFFPDDEVTVSADDVLEVGGAAFGGTRIAKVEITLDGGKTWQQADITSQMDADNVWVFWKARIKFPGPGEYRVNVRATDIHGNQQQEEDPERYDGTSAWPLLSVDVTE